MRRVFWAIVVLAGLLLVPAAALSARTYSAERFDVDMVVREDGSLIVTETVTFDFQGGPFTYVFRELPTDRTDGVTVLEGTMNGLRMPGGIEPGEIDLQGRDPIEVTWRFVPMQDTEATFSLTYLVEGVIQQTPDADILTWQALPEDHEYPIAATTITVTYPADVDLVAAPVVERWPAEVATAPGQVRITASDLGENDFIILTLPFAPGSIIQEPPRWQTEQQRVLNTVPEWLGLAALIFVAGLVLLLLWHTRQPVSPGSAHRAPDSRTSPPDPLPPALAGALIQNGSSSWTQAIGTLFDLAQRGVLRIEEITEKKWYQSRDFEVQLIEQPGDLRPHERGLLDLMFTSKAGWVPTVRLSELQHRLGKQWKLFGDSLRDEMQLAGYLDPNQKQHKTRLVVLGFILVLAGLVGLLFTMVAIVSSGMWPPIFVVGALFLLGLVAFVLGSSTSLLSTAGRSVRPAWQAFRDYLKGVTKTRTEASAELFEAYLPYAAAFGLAEAWVKFFKSQGLTQAPAWFHAVADGDGSEIAVFVALMAATNSAGGTAGAAGAAAGAAGGGASGAG